MATVLTANSPAHIQAIAGRKLQSLDGLRAIAILLVFFHHMKSYIPVVNLPSFLMRMYVWQGWIGVDLFFVLSGFLITGILIDTRESVNYFTGFYARRVLRIFPLYYFVLVGLVVLGVFLGKSEAPWALAIVSQLPLPQDRWVYFSFLTNWTCLWKAQWDTQFSSILAHFWSLGVEEQFYFIWPLVIWLVRPRHMPWVAGGLALLSAMVRLMWVLHYNLNLVIPPLSIEIALATVCRMDALFIGALCAWFFHDIERVKKVAHWLPLVGSLGVGSFFVYFTCLLYKPQPILHFFYGPALIEHDYEDLIRLFLLCGGFTLLAIGFGAIILLTAYNEKRKSFLQGVLQSRVLGLIGRYSYGIYVYHIPITILAGFFLFPRLMSGVTTKEEQIIAQCAYMVIMAAVSYIVAAISYELFEKRVLRLKRHFEPRYIPASAGNLELERGKS